MAWNAVQRYASVYEGGSGKLEFARGNLRVSSVLENQCRNAPERDPRQWTAQTGIFPNAGSNGSFAPARRLFGGGESMDHVPGTRGCEDARERPSREGRQSQMMRQREGNLLAVDVADSAVKTGGDGGR